jgi:hypothetical protein
MFLFTIVFIKILIIFFFFFFFFYKQNLHKKILMKLKEVPDWEKYLKKFMFKILVEWDLI